MGFNFPSSPTVGQTYDIYTFDGEKWTTVPRVLGVTYPPPDLTVWPDASNTGVPVGTSLTAHSGDLNSSSNGQVIDSMFVTGGTIIINHDNVTVQRCKVDTTGNYCVRVIAGKLNVLIRDCELFNAQNGVFGANMNVRRCNIYAIENGITVSGGHNVWIQDNFIHDFYQPGVDPHYDGIAAQGSCNNITIQHNRINLGFAQTSCLFFTDDFGPATNLKTINNYFNGGGYTIVVNGALTAVVVQDNLLGPGLYGYFTNNTPAENLTLSGNVSTTGIYLNGDVPPIVGTVAFQSSVPVTAGSEVNNNTGFRVAAALAQSIATEFRAVFYNGTAGLMGLEAAAFGKSISTSQIATAPLTPLLFGGGPANVMPSIPYSCYVVSDWTPRGALVIATGDVMLIGFNTRNPGSTGVSTGSNNVITYYGNTANMTDANPGYSITGTGACYALARIETR